MSNCRISLGFVVSAFSFGQGRFPPFQTVYHARGMLPEFDPLVHFDGAGLSLGLKRVRPVSSFTKELF